MEIETTNPDWERGLGGFMVWRFRLGVVVGRWMQDFLGLREDYCESIRCERSIHSQTSMKAQKWPCKSHVALYVSLVKGPK